MAEIYNYGNQQCPVDSFNYTNNTKMVFLDVYIGQLQYNRQFSHKPFSNSNCDYNIHEPM